jgi:Flp pilus assembly protein TadD
MSLDSQFHAQSLTQEAQIDFESGRFEAAAQILELAHQYAPTDVPILVNWGMSLQRLGRLDQALQRLEIACELQPQFALAWSQRGDVCSLATRLQFGT